MGADGGWSLCERPENRTEKRRAPDTTRTGKAILAPKKPGPMTRICGIPPAAKGLDWLVEQQLLAQIIATQVPPEARSAADFACGTGRVLEFLGRRFPHPVGIDVSPDMLALARDRCPEASFITGDVTTAPDLAPGPFDLITAFRFFLNAEPKLRDEVMAWMRDALGQAGWPS